EDHGAGGIVTGAGLVQVDTVAGAPEDVVPRGCRCRPFEIPRGLAAGVLLRLQLRELGTEQLRPFTENSLQCSTAGGDIETSRRLSFRRARNHGECKGPYRAWRQRRRSGERDAWNVSTPVTRGADHAGFSGVSGDTRRECP